jgi:hypothetical protein
LAACTHPNSGGATAVLVPWPQTDGSYALSQVDLTTVNDMDHLSGSMASFYAEPHSSSAGGMTGEPLVAHFARKGDDLYIAKDVVTLQAATVYAHLEQLLALDHELGVDRAGHWPIRVGVKAPQQTKSGASVLNNAVYDPMANVLMFSPTQGSGLQVDFNAGVVGHEHFHAIFNSLAGREILKAYGSRMNLTIADDLHYGVAASQACPSLLDLVAEAHGQPVPKVGAESYNSYLVRGVNEGLADFWGWVYVNDPNFLNPSFTHGELGFRNLSTRSRPLLPHEYFESMVEHLEARKLRDGCLPYSLGTNIANLLYNLTRTLQSPDRHGYGVSREARMQMAKWVIQALPQMGEIFLKNFSTHVLTTEEVLQPLFDLVPKTHANCELLRSSLLNSPLLPSECRTEPTAAP